MGTFLLINSEIRDTPTGALLHTFDTREWGPAAFSHDSGLIISAGRELKVWDARKIELRKSIAQPVGGLQVRAVAISPDDKRVLVGGDDSTARVWDLENGRRLLELKGHGEVLNGVPVSNEAATVAFSSDGRRLATGSLDRKARIWSLEEGRLVHVLNSGGPRVAAVAFSPSGSQLLTGSSDGVATLWDVESGNTIRDLSNTSGLLVDLFNMTLDRDPMIVRRASTAVFSPDGKYVLTGFGLSNLHLWKPDSGLLFRELKSSGLVSAVFSPDGKRALVCESGRGAPYRHRNWEDHPHYSGFA